MKTKLITSRNCWGYQALRRGSDDDWYYCAEIPSNGILMTATGVKLVRGVVIPHRRPMVMRFDSPTDHVLFTLRWS